MTRTTSPTFAVWALTMGWMTGCAAEAGQVEPGLSLIGVGASALSAGSVVELRGTYTGCAERAGSWSVRVAGVAPLAHDALSVVKNDAACSLAVTEVVADQTYRTLTPIPLGASYQSSAAGFAPSGGGPLAFHANAKLDAADFGADFVITLLHSADPEARDGGAVGATYATVQASGQAVAVVPPDYTISFTSGSPLLVQVDANKVVTSSAGTAVLLDGAYTGTAYVIDPGTLPASPSFLAVQTAFLANTQRVISGANPSIPASYFTLSGASLATPVVRTVIVARALSGVLGYELIKVTFQR